MAVILSQFRNEASTHSKGFRPDIGPDTKDRYFSLWSNFLLGFWRLSRRYALERRTNKGIEGSKITADSDPVSDSDLEEKCHDETDSGSAGETMLFAGTTDQKMAFQGCLEAAANDDVDSLRCSVLKWSMTTIEHDLPRYRFESPVLSYCAMLAVDHSSQGWKLPGNFNSSLSGMISCAQHLVFREACRIVDEGSSEQHQHQHLDEVLVRLTRRWMRQERSTTYGILLNWRLMLFNVAKREVSSKNATWSLDGSEVCFQGTAITMQQITQLYHRTLERARLILDPDLLLGADHLPRMSTTALQEAEHREEAGWWFALDPRNKVVLQGHQTHLVGHIKSTPAIREVFLQGKSDWPPSAMRLYEHHVQQF